MANSRYDAAFSLYDADKDGKVSKSELGAAFEKLGRELNDKDLTALMRVVDKDGNGHIDKQEFYKMMDAQKGKEQKNMQEAFNNFDKDGNGFISKSEMKEAMKEVGVSMTDPEVEDTMNEVDFNQDGKISFDEFKVMMSNV